MQRLQRGEEAIAQRGHGTGREGDPLAGQVGADLLALEVRDSAAVLADFARPEGASRQGEEHAGLALVRVQSPAAVRALPRLGDEIDAQRGSVGARGAGDPRAGPARLAGLFQQQRQQGVVACSKRAATASCLRSASPSRPDASPRLRSPAKRAPDA